MVSFVQLTKCCHLPSSMSCSRHVITWPAHEPPHVMLPWL